MQKHINSLMGKIYESTRVFFFFLFPFWMYIEVNVRCATFIAPGLVTSFKHKKSAARMCVLFLVIMKEKKIFGKRLMITKMPDEKKYGLIFVRQNINQFGIALILFFRFEGIIHQMLDWNNHWIAYVLWFGSVWKKGATFYGWKKKYVKINSNELMKRSTNVCCCERDSDWILWAISDAIWFLKQRSNFRIPEQNAQKQGIAQQNREEKKNTHRKLHSKNDVVCGKVARLSFDILKLVLKWHIHLNMNGV